jgi:tRNA modification GTPase
VRLVDTAGLRSTDDQVERIGVDVARRAAAGADLLLYLVDGRAPASEEDVAALETLRPAVVVRTKSDLWGGGEEGLAVSAETGEGMDALRRLVAERLSGTECEGELPALERHRQALAAAAEALAEAAALSEEPLMAAALRRALHALGEITGETASEELLDRIFARFCIGK